ncbi:MAG: GTP cyclohydrolase I FolE2 [Gammaproteobacteria bacterium]|nr:GTP cyclohydrolase I FolE2 [Gammaproteobacteria bacterium]
MSTAASVPTAFKAIEDTQNAPDIRQTPINKVGVKGLMHPVRIAGREGAQHTIARFNMYVNVRHNVKGAHMSRFVELLMRRQDEIDVGQIDLASFESMLTEMTRRLEADTGHIDMSFPFFIEKSAPVSGARSVMNYDVTFSGELIDGTASVRAKVVVPVTSLCPCSKNIAAYGAHNQRSHVTLTVRAGHPIFIEDLIERVEAQASSELYGLLKRADEKYVTERAYENPKFVEDVVRDIALEINDDPRILAYRIEAENFESIHNHSAYAMIEKNEAD